MLALPPTWPGGRPSRTNHHLKARAALVLDILGCGHTRSEAARERDHDEAVCLERCNATLDAYYAGGG